MQPWDVGFSSFLKIVFEEMKKSYRNRIMERIKPGFELVLTRQRLCTAVHLAIHFFRIECIAVFHIATAPIRKKNNSFLCWFTQKTKTKSYVSLNNKPIFTTKDLLFIKKRKPVFKIYYSCQLRRKLLHSRRSHNSTGRTAVLKNVISKTNNFYT